MSAHKYAEFKVSNGWVDYFLKKKGFSMRARTTGPLTLKLSWEEY